MKKPYKKANKKSKPKKRKRKYTRNFLSRSYRLFRKLVSLRDEKQCIICHYVDQKKTRGRTNIHHIKKWEIYPDLRYDPSNGCVLCWRHHQEVNNKEELWEELLVGLVKKSECEYVQKYDMSPYVEKEETNITDR